MNFMNTNNLSPLNNEDKLYTITEFLFADSNCIGFPVINGKVYYNNPVAPNKSFNIPNDATYIMVPSLINRTKIEILNKIQQNFHQTARRYYDDF